MPILNGDHARDLLAQRCRRLVDLHGPVVNDREPGPVREMRLCLRQLRTCLQQFEAALRLPRAVSAKRLAKTERRLTITRDLDGLRQRLEGTFLPQAPEREMRRLKPVLRQLKRERQLAHDHLVTALRSSEHLEQIAQLQGWLREPLYTELGGEPLDEWLLEWEGPTAQLLLHGGWWSSVRDEDPETLRDLCERIEGVRHRLASLPAAAGAGGRGWSARLERGQDLLTELLDLGLLRKAIDDQLRDGIERTVPQLDWLLEQHRIQCWRQWRELAETMLSPRQRQRDPIHRLAERQPRDGPAGRARSLLLSLAARLA